jgi:hypothetical protein
MFEKSPKNTYEPQLEPFWNSDQARSAASSAKTDGLLGGRSHDLFRLVPSIHN